MRSYIREARVQGRCHFVCTYAARLGTSVRWRRGAQRDVVRAALTERTRWYCLGMLSSGTVAARFRPTSAAERSGAQRSARVVSGRSVNSRLVNGCSWNWNSPGLRHARGWCYTNPKPKPNSSRRLRHARGRCYNDGERFLVHEHRCPYQRYNCTNIRY